MMVRAVLQMIMMNAEVPYCYNPITHEVTYVGVDDCEFSFISGTGGGMSNLDSAYNPIGILVVRIAMAFQMVLHLKMIVVIVNKRISTISSPIQSLLLLVRKVLKQVLLKQ